MRVWILLSFLSLGPFLPPTASAGACPAVSTYTSLGEFGHGQLAPGESRAWRTSATADAGAVPLLAGTEWIVARGSRNPTDPLELMAGGGVLQMTAYVLTGPLACDPAPSCSQIVTTAATCKLIGGYSFLVLTNAGPANADGGYTITFRNTVASA